MTVKDVSDICRAKGIGQLNLRPLYCQGNKALLPFIPRHGGLYRRSWNLQKRHLFVDSIPYLSAYTKTPTLLPLPWIYFHVRSVPLSKYYLNLLLQLLFIEKFIIVFLQHVKGNEPECARFVTACARAVRWLTCWKYVLASSFRFVTYGDSIQFTAIMLALFHWLLLWKPSDGYRKVPVEFPIRWSNRDTSCQNLARLNFILRPSTHEKQPTEQIEGEILYNRALCLVLYLYIWIMKLMK